MALDMPTATPRITRLGLPDSWIYQDSRAKQLAEVGLDRAGLLRAFRATLTPSSPAVPAPVQSKPQPVALGARN